MRFVQFTQGGYSIGKYRKEDRYGNSIEPSDKEF